MQVLVCYLGPDRGSVAVPLSTYVKHEEAARGMAVSFLKAWWNARCCAPGLRDTGQREGDEREHLTDQSGLWIDGSKRLVASGWCPVSELKVAFEATGLQGYTTGLRGFGAGPLTGCCSSRDGAAQGLEASNLVIH